MGSQLAKAATIQVTTNRSPSVFWPGEHVQGKVSVELVDDVRLRTARIWLVGMAATRWQETTSIVSDRHELFKVCHNIDPNTHRLSTSKSDTSLSAQALRNEPDRVRFASDERPIVVTRGSHLYNFRLKLPATLPLSSFRLDTGSATVEVRYFLKLEVSSDSDEDEDEEESYELDEDIFVISQVDLNRQCASHKLPVQIEKHLALRQCCVGNGSISCTVKLDKGAYVPGEMMHVFVDILNESTKLVSGTRVTLEQHVLSYSRLRAQTLTSYIFCILGHRIKANSEAQYHDVVHVPPLPPTTLESKEPNIVAIRYFVQVSLEMSSWLNRSVKVNVPVIIGTVPFRKKNDVAANVTFATFDFESGNIRIYSDRASVNRTEILYPYYRSS